MAKRQGLSDAGRGPGQASSTWCESVFRIVAIDGDNATVLAEGDAPGAYEFPTSLAGLVAVADGDTSS